MEGLTGDTAGELLASVPAGEEEDGSGLVTDKEGSAFDALCTNQVKRLTKKAA